MSTNNIQFFQPHEFDSPDLPGSGTRMRWGTIIKLNAMRTALGHAVDISSGYRSAAHNIKVGGKSQSAHLGGYAADLRGVSDDELIAYLDAAWAAGFRRFGIMATALHVDDDPGKARLAMWNYGNTPPARWKLAQRWMAAKRKTIV